jgi:hypothetical protein
MASGIVAFNLKVPYFAMNPTMIPPIAGSGSLQSQMIVAR